jgi:WXG100 family type VII secretion target
MSNIVLSSEDILAYASQIESLNQTVQSVFTQINSEVNVVSSVWNSPASASFMQQFALLKPSFETYVQVLNQYAQFLQQSAQAYQESEQMLVGSMAG